MTGESLAAKRAEAHTCHAEACEAHVPPSMFMCRKHWYMVPMDLRGWVLATYQPGQEKLDGTAWPTDDYLDYTSQAIEAVATKEGRRD